MRENIEQFVKRHGITLDFVPAPKNPNFFDAMEGSAHWLCTLKAGGRKLETYFTKGPGLRIWAKAKPGTAYLGPEPLSRPKGWKIGESRERCFRNRVVPFLRGLGRRLWLRHRQPPGRAHL